jgi:hypothetical protein
MMSVSSPVAVVAPISLRLRLAVATLLVSWALAALFIVLGWRESRASAAEAAPAVSQPATAVRANAPGTFTLAQAD